LKNLVIGAIGYFHFGGIHISLRAHFTSHGMGIQMGGIFGLRFGTIISFAIKYFNLNYRPPPLSGE